MPRRLIWPDTLRLMWIFCFRKLYSIPPSPREGMCRPGLACTDCAGWSESIHYEGAIMMVFSWDCSYNKYDRWTCMRYRVTDVIFWLKQLWSSEFTMRITRAWRESVVTKNLFWKPWFRGNFDPFVNNANLGAIAPNEQWHLNFHCLPRKII